MDKVQCSGRRICGPPNQAMNPPPLWSLSRPQRFPRLAKNARLGAGYRQAVGPTIEVIMICPQCGKEYRAGYTRCNDCSPGILVEPLQEERPENTSTPHAAAVQPEIPRAMNVWFGLQLFVLSGFTLTPILV